MSKICSVTGKHPISGNHRSHAMNAVKRRFLPNLQSRRFWSASKKCFIKLRICTQGIRMIDKKGIDVIISHTHNNKNLKK